MKKINDDKFLRLLKSSETNHTDYEVFINSNIVINISDISTGNQFVNCVFKGKKIEFRDLIIKSENECENLIYLDFKDCKFINQIRFCASYFQNITFIDCKILHSINITDCNINKVVFKKTNINTILNETEKKTLIVLDYITINIELKLIDVKNIHKVRLRKIGVLGKSKLQNCQLGEFKMSLSKFKNDFEFLNVTLFSNSSFFYNVFNKTNFNNTDFGLSAEFKNNDFEKTTLFENAKNLDNTSLTFKSCKFVKYAYFNNSKIKHLSFDTTKFMEFSSFQDTVFETINIDRTVFDSPAFFDDIKILKIVNCDRRTIRNIKQELGKSGNTIDYDSFKAYEMQAHRLEVAKKADCRLFNKDWIILKVGAHFSDNGLNWFKALTHTIFWSFLIYCIFYWVYHNGFNFNKIEFSNTNSFLTGYLRYLNPTDFYDPLSFNRMYLKNSIQFFLLMIGKIFIAIGLYEILKSFRKFKK